MGYYFTSDKDQEGIVEDVSHLHYQIEKEEGNISISGKTV
jgi:hypothetical protein